MYYDLHIHSCLSPCGDRDMTVNNIVHMAALKGLELIALTDHNTAKNCPAFLQVAAAAGIRALPGMELNTSEEIHTVCLFRKLENALAFDRYVYDRLPAIANRPEIFGEQLLCDETDAITGTVSKLLLSAAAISFAQLDSLMETFGGIYFPSHIDRTSYSLLSSLGFVPEENRFPAFELSEMTCYAELVSRNPYLAGIPCVHNSDAHYLWDISEAEYSLDQRLLELLL